MFDNVWGKAGGLVTELFSEAYIETCFTTWYGMNQPTNLNILRQALPESPDKRVPATSTLRDWIETYGWKERADALTAKAIEVAEHSIVERKADLLRRQFEDALEVGQAARDHILAFGFDTTSSAVSALKWASEEQRTVMGVSEMLLKISKMSPEDLQARAEKLLKRKVESVDGEVVDSESTQGEQNEQ